MLAAAAAAPRGDYSFDSERYCPFDEYLVLKMLKVSICCAQVGAEAYGGFGSLIIQL